MGKPDEDDIRLERMRALVDRQIDDLERWHTQPVRSMLIHVGIPMLCAFAIGAVTAWLLLTFVVS